MIFYFVYEIQNRLKTYQIALNNYFELMSLNDQNILWLVFTFVELKKRIFLRVIIKVSNFQCRLDIDRFIHVKWVRKSEKHIFFEINTLEHFQKLIWFCSFKKATRVNALEGAFNLIPYSEVNIYSLVSQVLPFCYCLCRLLLALIHALKKSKGFLSLFEK